MLIEHNLGATILRFTHTVGCRYQQTILAGANRFDARALKPKLDQLGLNSLRAFFGKLLVKANRANGIGVRTDLLKSKNTIKLCGIGATAGGAAV